VSVPIASSVAFSRIVDLIQRLATVFVGLFAGALCYVGFVLIPTWARLPARTFLEVFQAQLPITDSYMPVLAIGGLLCSLIAVLRTRPHGGGAWLRRLVPPFAILVAIAISVAMNGPINTWLAHVDAVPGAAELAARQHEWMIGHVARTSATVVAFLALVRVPG
jgi:hypothetical protein